MKYIKYLFLIVISTFLSCSNEMEEAMNETKYVSFTPSYASTLSRATDTHFEVGDQIGVFAVWDLGQEYFPGLSDNVYANNIPYKYTESARFEPMSSGIVIPENKKGLFYCAIYPYSANLGNAFMFDVRKDQTGNNYTLSDLIIAFTDEGSIAERVGLPFYHTLSKISIEIGPNSNSSDLIGVELLDMAYKTRMDMTELMMYIQSEQLTSIEMNRFANNCFKAIVPPQKIESGSDLCRLIYKNKKVVVKANRSVDMESGQAYSFVIP